MVQTKRAGTELETVEDEVGRQLCLTLDSPLVGKVKGDRPTMVFSFFAISKGKVERLGPYNDGTVYIKVTGLEYGVANMWDKEILVYMISLIQDKANRAEPISQTMTFTAADLFRVIGRKPSGSAYEQLEDALRRLKGTSIETSIETGGEGESGAFSWVSEYKLRYRRGRDGEKVLRAVEVTICSWLWRAITRDKQLLTYHPRYFELSPIEKRLYEVARAHCGQLKAIRMNIEKLRRRVGYTGELKYFKRDLLAISKKRNPLPDYGFSVIDPRSRSKVNAIPSDPRLPKPRGRTPLKQYMVFFFRSDSLASMPTFWQVPDADEDGIELFPQRNEL
jgi:plasmid replication initiation protein